MDRSNDKVPMIQGGIIFAKRERPLHRREVTSRLPHVIPCNLLVLALVCMGGIRVLNSRRCGIICLKACLMRLESVKELNNIPIRIIPDNGNLLISVHNKRGSMRPHLIGHVRVLCNNDGRPKGHPLGRNPLICHIRRATGRHPIANKYNWASITIFITSSNISNA